MIWCVEDDPTIRDIEVYALSSVGFEAKGFCDGASFLSALKSEKVLPELIVLDVMLPGTDGMQLLGRLKASETYKTNEHTVTADGERITLTYKEFELLRLFLTHIGKAFTRDNLFAEVWGMDYCGETRTVDMHIKTLREKLGKYGGLIKTVRGVGYRMEAETKNGGKETNELIND